MTTHQLVYLSTANQPFTSAELRGLLLHARAANARRHITGLLLYQEGKFLQVLEGATDEVYALYKRIAADPRHGHLCLLADGPVSARSFPDWCMGFATDGPAGAACFAQVQGYVNPASPALLARADPYTLPALLRLLASFARGPHAHALPA